MFLRHPEKQYLSLIRKIIQNGNIENGRNGKTYVSIGEMMRFSLKKNTIPLLTTKRVAWKTCLRELLWFVRGQTDNNILLKNNVTIWNDNATIGRHSSHGIFPKNDLGPIYGHQWRHFNAPYLSCKNDFTDFIPRYKNHFMFLDPPYYLEKKSKLYGKNGDLHESFDHKKLASLLKEVPTWILCYNDCSYIRKLYETYTIVEVNWSYGMNKSKKSSEILIHNSKKVKKLN